MNYVGNKVAITGINGFIGSHLEKRLEKLGADVWVLNGDVRDENSFASLDHNIDYLFHFGAPSSQVLFKRMPAYSAEVTIKGFMNALNAANRIGAKLIYPSTGSLSYNHENEYSRCKKVCEDAAVGSNALGIRIFGTYGPGEEHKADYASPPYLFARDIVNGKRPVVFGDGTQKRDFIYIDDTVEGILSMAQSVPPGIIDLGSGKSISFKDLIAIISKEVGFMATIKYVDSPQGYITRTSSEINPNHYIPKVPIESGIKKLVNHLLDEKRRVEDYRK